MKNTFLEEVKFSNPLLQEILCNLLNLNPYFRWTPAECLKSHFFDDIRKPQLEKPASIKLKLVLD